MKAKQVTKAKQVSIHPGIVSEMREHYECDQDRLSQIVGLSEKTLRALDHGGRHKVETVFQLESALWEQWSDSWADIWTTQVNGENAPPRLYSKLDELSPITEFKINEGKRCFAISLPSSGLIKLIEDRAQRFKSSCDPETVGDSPDHLRKQRLLAYDNYVWNLSEAMEGRRQIRRDNRMTPSNRQACYGVPEEYRFTIQDALLPLTNAQSKCVQLLDQAINELIRAAVETKDTYSDSLLDQMKSEGIEPQRKALMALIAKLKRLNINVLAYSRSKKVRMMDGTYGVSDSEDGYGLKSSEYLFTVYSGLTHIVLASSNYLRVPFPIHEYEIKWTNEPMWENKMQMIGDEMEPYDVIEGLGTRERSNEEISIQKKSNVLKLVTETNGNEDGTH